LPVTRTAEKELRVAESRRERNKGTRTLSKSTVRKAEKLIFAGDMASAREAVVTAISTLDKAANKGVMHANKAARSKSRLMKKLNKAAEITGESKREERPSV
jgi:small subunit ribosomal protein S20